MEFRFLKDLEEYLKEVLKKDNTPNLLNAFEAFRVMNAWLAADEAVRKDFVLRHWNVTRKAIEAWKTDVVSMKDLKSLAFCGEETFDIEDEGIKLTFDLDRDDLYYWVIAESGGKEIMKIRIFCRRDVTGKKDIREIPYPSYERNSIFFEIAKIRRDAGKENAL